MKFVCLDLPLIRLKSSARPRNRRCRRKVEVSPPDSGIRTELDPFPISMRNHIDSGTTPVATVSVFFTKDKITIFRLSTNFQFNLIELF